MNNLLGFKWIEIPSGNILMGISNEKSLEMASKYNSKYFLSASPQVEVFVDTFAISTYPVTNRQYKLFLDATRHPPGAWLSGFSEDNLDHPARHINLYDAKSFCDWAKCRLPTCAEWEKAAGGANGLEYPWGNEWYPDLCNNNENGKKSSTTPVYAFPQGKSPYDVYDMAGNVWEWTSTSVLSDRTPAIWWAWNNSRWNHLQNSGSSIEGYDYIYPHPREWYILKGGGADSNRLGMCCSFRLTGYEENIQGDFFGFRCVKDA
jgi:formylglycine-generating enzyme required for sulfatase activity